MGTVTYQLGLYEKAMPDGLSFQQQLEVVKRCNFDYLEMSIDESEQRLSRLDMDRQQRKAMIETMYETGITVDSICLSAHRKYPLGSSDRNTRLRSQEILSKSITLAGDLGIRVIMLAGYDVYYEEGSDNTRQYFTENLRAGAELAAARGIMLGFETMETAFMNTVGKAMAYVSQISTPYLTVYPDIGNTTNAALAEHRDWKQDLISGKGHICALHLKETKPGIFREVPYGTGHVDFAAAIPLALELGIRRFVAEFWYDAADDDWEGTIRRNGDYLRKYFHAPFFLEHNING